MKRKEKSNLLHEIIKEGLHIYIRYAYYTDHAAQTMQERTAKLFDVAVITIRPNACLLQMKLQNKSVVRDTTTWYVSKLLYWEYSYKNKLIQQITSVARQCGRVCSFTTTTTGYINKLLGTLGIHRNSAVDLPYISLSCKLMSYNFLVFHSFLFHSKFFMILIEITI